MPPMEDADRTLATTEPEPERPTIDPATTDPAPTAAPIQTLRLAPGAGPSPLAVGLDAEAVAVPWSSARAADVLVTFSGGARGREALLFRRAPADDQAPEAGLVYDEGEPVPGLDGLRCVGVVSTGDGAGRFDLVAIDLALGLVHLPNLGTADAPRFGPRRPLGQGIDLGLTGCRVVNVAVDDWDGDGLPDLIVGAEEMVGYEPPGATPDEPFHHRVGFDQQGAHPGYDRAGRWLGRAPRPRLAWLRNVGAPSAPRFDPPEAIEAESSRAKVGARPAPLVIAWAGPGGVELLLADADGPVRLHRNFGGQRPPVLMDPRPIHLAGPENTPLRLPEDRSSVVTADLDRTGRDALLVATASGRAFAIRPSRGRDQAARPVPLLSTDRALRFGAGAVVAAADLDDDGHIDLIAGDAAGRLFLARGRGDAAGALGLDFDAPAELDALGEPFRIEPGPAGRLDGPAAPSLGFACPTIADWDGNGRLDLVVGTADGDVLFLHNNGSAHQPRFERPIRIRCAGAPLAIPPRVRPGAIAWDTHPDSDGNDMDLIALDLQGFLCVYPREGPYEVGEPRALTDRLGRVLRLDGGFGLAGRVSLWAGPWCAPDRIDVLVGLPRSSRGLVGPLCGRDFERLDDVPTVLLFERIDEDVVIPRPIFHADGRPLSIGRDGCSPTAAGPDRLIVGSDDGLVHAFARSSLRW
jgi:hypothetical protein